MNERILLVETSVEEQNRVKYDPNGNYALGLAYLSSVLKEKGYEVLTEDLAPLEEKECLIRFRSILNKFKPKIIGISIMSMTRASSYKAIRIAKKILPNVKIILGGIHASIMYEQILKNFPVEAVVIGEGEETIKEVIPALISGLSLNKVKGIAILKRGKVILTPKRELICDLDSIPFPAHSYFMNSQRTKACVLSSRGCPNNCSFCSLHIITNRRYRMRSYQNVISELLEITSKYPQIKEIEFSDDTFTLSQERVINFCKEIIKRKISLKFICSARIKPMSEKMLYWMQKAGFKEIRFGIETGSRKLLQSIHKNITQEEIIDTFKICSKFPKIRFVKFLMVGFPGENDETIKETIELTKKLQKLVPMDFFYATPLWVYPGTEVYDIMKKSGKIDDNFWLGEEPCPYYTVENSKEKLFTMSGRIGFETSLARGYSFFLGFMIKKFLDNPIYQLKRLIKNKFLLPIIFKKLKS